MRADTSRPTLHWRRPPIEAFGPYDVHEEIGRGGLASVHYATDRAAERLGCGRPIALERVRPELATDWQLVTAFMHEAHLAKQLRHPHIARTHAYGRLDGTYYCATELVGGPTLREIMRQSRTAAGAIPVPVVVELLIQICDALDYLHGQPVRIIHRDVSASNFVLAGTGELKLVDLGIAKLAPETAGGELDPRADLHAVGLLAHELLVGRGRVKPGQAPPPSRWNPDVSADLDDIVVLALQRDLARRWQNAAALRFALRAVAAELGGGGTAEVVAWTAWAFGRAPRRDSSKVRRLVQALERDHRAAS